MVDDRSGVIEEAEGHNEGAANDKATGGSLLPPRTARYWRKRMSCANIVWRESLPTRRLKLRDCGEPREERKRRGVSVMDL